MQGNRFAVKVDISFHILAKCIGRMGWRIGEGIHEVQIVQKTPGIDVYFRIRAVLGKDDDI